MTLTAALTILAAYLALVLALALYFGRAAAVADRRDPRAVDPSLGTFASAPQPTPAGAGDFLPPARLLFGKREVHAGADASARHPVSPAKRRTFSGLAR
jgi:hypothetical protein